MTDTATSSSDASENVTVLDALDTQVRSVAAFDEYTTVVARNFCPYLTPSSERGATRYTTLKSQTSSLEDAEKIIFASSLALTELLRARRATAGSRGVRPPLLCENALFVFPNIADESWKCLLDWPHWVLKFRYTEVGILFGKFVKGGIEQARDGRRQLPSPPCSFISVRESVRARDPQFFTRGAWLLPALEASHDSGQSLLSGYDGFSECAPILGEFCRRPDPEMLTRAVRAVIESDLYRSMKQSAALNLEAHTSESNSEGEGLSK